jgi:hypothetical protein
MDDYYRLNTKFYWKSKRAETRSSSWKLATDLKELGTIARHNRRAIEV